MRKASHPFRNSRLAIHDKKAGIMLDKSLSYYNVIMKRFVSLPMPIGHLPEEWRL